MSRARALALMLRLTPIVAVLVLCFCAYRILLLGAPPLHADEAGHGLPAARMTAALNHGDWAGFLGATREDILWPFFHPWFIAAFLVAFGISTEAARASSLVALAATLCLLPGFVRELARSDDEQAGGGGPWAASVGWLSVAALLASRFLWGLSCTVMSESLGMFLGVLTLWCAARASRRAAFWPAVACGTLAGLAFLTKYNYGVPLMGALVLAQALRTREQGRRPLLGACLGMALPVTAWAVLVLGMNSERISLLLSYLKVNRDEGLRGLDNFLFYPRGLVEMLGSATSIAIALGLGSALVRRRSPARWASQLFVVLTLALLIPHPNKQLRYLVPVLPVVLALAEAEFARWLARRRGFGLLWCTGAAGLLLAREPLVQMREEAHANTQLVEAQAVLDFVVAHVPHDQPLLLLGSTGILPHMALTWELFEHEGREPDVGLLLFPGAVGWEPQYRAGYPAEMRPEYAAVLGQTLASGRYGTVATFELGPTSPFLPDWLAKWDAWGQNYVHAMKSQEGYALHDEAAFHASAAVVRIYVKSPL